MGKTVNIDPPITADQLIKLLEAGNNITLTVDDCKVRIDANGGGGSSTGIKYHLKSGDSIIVNDCFEYLVACDLILDVGSQITIEEGGRLVIIEGLITNDGVIVNDGLIKNGLN